MTSCQSVKTEYIDRYVVPEITFPIFPALDREINEDGSWTIPKNDVDALAEFHLRYKTAIEIYNHDKELFEEITE